LMRFTLIFYKQIVYSPISL